MTTMKSYRWGTRDTAKATTIRDVLDKMDKDGAPVGMLGDGESWFAIVATDGALMERLIEVTRRYADRQTRRAARP